MPNFSYLGKPIKEATDDELLDWLILFLNSSHSSSEWKEYDEFMDEVPNRDKKFQNSVNYYNHML